MKKYSNILINILFSFLTLFSIKDYFYMYIKNNIVIYLLLIVFFLLLLLYYFKLNKNINLSKKYKIFIIIMSFFITIGYSYEKTTTATLFFGSFSNFITSLIKMIGFYVFFIVLINKFFIFMSKNYKYKSNVIIVKFINHPYLYSFIFLFLCYSIYLISYYPGIINYDNANQIKEVLGFHTRYIDAIIPISSYTSLTNFNPIVHTLLLGNFFKIGVLIGNPNLGLFMYTLFQMLIVISIYSYAISFSIKMKINPLYSFVVLLILGLIPVFGFYSITAVKDTLYTSFLLLFSLEVYYLCKKDIIVSRDYLNLFLISLLVCLFRNNGIVIVVPTILFLGFKNKKYIITILLIMISFLSFSKVLLPKLNVSGTSVREVLSIPFQQTARSVKMHPEKVSDKDKEAISKILDYDNLAKNYRKELADPVKNKFNKYYTKKELSAYLDAWVRGIIVFPGEYIDAWVNTISGYFNPFVNSWKVYHKLNPKLQLVGINYHYNDLKIARDLLFYTEIGVEVSPLGLILNIAILFWLSILIFIKCHEKNNYIFLIPNLISVLFCIISPANTYFRYIYPTLVMLVCMFPLIKDTIEK